MHQFLLAFLLVPAGCVAVPPIAPPVAAPPFDPLRFFVGATEGHGTLRIAFRQPATTLVEGHGRIDGETLVLDQTVREGGKPARNRQWRIHAVAPGRYAGTLSDATGPVSGTTHGNRLHLAFAMKGGLAADQELDLAPDGQSAHNVMTIRKLGLTVASLDETIRRVR